MGVAVGNMIEPFVNKEFHMLRFYLVIRQIYWNKKDIRGKDRIWEL